MSSSELRNRKPQNKEGALKQKVNTASDEQVSSQFSVLDVLRVLIGAIGVVALVSYYVTGTFTWDYETRWTNPSYIKFRLSNLNGPLSFTEQELSKYNGKDPSLPIYLAINGSVYDVSAKPLTYGPGGPYGFFSGRDAVRAFITGCFEQDLTHDLRGIDYNTAKSAVEGWQSFYSNNHKYWYVGTVEHPPLTGDPPPLCEGMPAPNNVHNNKN